MKLSLSVSSCLALVTGFSLAAAIDDTKAETKIIRRHDNSEKDDDIDLNSLTSSSDLHHPYDQTLTSWREIKSGTPVVDLYDYVPSADVFNPLPIVVTPSDGEPEFVYSFEQAAGPTFTFATCEETNIDTSISIWTGFDERHLNFQVAHFSGCAYQPNLSWTPPTNATYYVKIGVFSPCLYRISVSTTWSADGDFPLFCRTCGPTTMPAMQRCCDRETELFGPACCGTVPYNPGESTCCGDSLLIPGNDKLLCAPSTQPSPAPTPVSSSSPSSQPSILTCEMTDLCDYDLKDDGMGGVEVVETYYLI